GNQFAQTAEKLLRPKFTGLVGERTVVCVPVGCIGILIVVGSLRPTIQIGNGVDVAGIPLYAAPASGSRGAGIGCGPSIYRSFTIRTRRRSRCNARAIDAHG